MSLIQIDHVCKRYVMGGETIRAFFSMKLELDSGDIMLCWFEMNGQASKLQVNRKRRE